MTENWVHVKDACQAYIDQYDRDDYSEDKQGDYENGVFEAALEAVFGEDVWGVVTAKQQFADDVSELASKDHPGRRSISHEEYVEARRKARLALEGLASQVGEAVP